MKKQLWKLGVLSLAAVLNFACAGGPLTGSSGGTSGGAPATAGGEPSATDSAIASSPGAAEFLARNTFLGFATISDRCIGQNRFLVFTSRADLIPQDTNGKRDIYLRDLRTGDMRVVSVATDGAQGTADSTDASISADGRFVVFRSASDNLVAGDTNNTEDIFLHNAATGATTRVSVDSSGNELNGTSLTPAVSANGRYVVFASEATGLAGITDTNGVQDIFLRDTLSGTTALVSTNSAQTDSANGASYDPAISAGLVTTAPSIVIDFDALPTQTPVTNQFSGVEFSLSGGVDSGGPAVTDSRGLTNSRTATYPTAQFLTADFSSPVSGISFFYNNYGFNGSNAYTLFDSTNSVIATGSLNFSGTYDVLAFSNVSSIQWYNGRSPSENWISSLGRLNYTASASASVEGEFIAFATEATDVIGGGLNGQRQIVRTERATPANRVLISQSAAAVQANGPCYEPSISNDGNSVAFFTLADNIGGAADANNLFDVYLRNVSGNTTTRQSVNIGGNDSDDHSGYPSLSADGSRVAFGSLATDLIGSDGNGRFDIFERSGGATTRVSESTASAEGNSESDIPGISLDGRYVAFRSAASNLDANDAVVDDDIFVRDLTGTTTVWQSKSCPAPSIWGQFSAAATQAVGDAPRSVVLGDLDEDGDLDLAIANDQDNNVSVLENTGDFSFTPHGPFAVGVRPGSLTLGDLDGDGDLDLATANFFANVTLLENTLETTPFTFTNHGPFPVGTVPRAVKLGDLDGDGDLDLATANFSNDVTVLENTLETAAFTFTSRGPFAVGTGPSSLNLGDLDGDGDLDLTTSNGGSDDLTVLENTLETAAFTFTARGPFVTGDGPRSTLGDLDGDGDLDVATGNVNDFNVTVLENTGALSFTLRGSFAAAGRPSSVTLGDLDGDGDLDMTISNFDTDDVTVLENTGAFNFTPRGPFAVGDDPQSVTLGDLDGDGALDLVTANLASDNATVLKNNGHPRIGPITDVELGSGEPRSPLVADFNGDGHMDVVWCQELTDQVVVSFGDTDGDGELGNAGGSTVALTGGARPRQAVYADFDNDGDLDILTANHGTVNTTNALENDGNGGFTVHNVATLSNGQAGVAVADFNNDGLMDAAITSENTNDVTLLRNTGFPSFAATTLATGSNPLGVSAGDLNADGNADLVVANFFGGVRVHTGNGDGTFNNPGSDIAVGTQPQTPRLADFDGDGVLDIAVSYSSTGGFSTAPGVTILLNDGTAAFPSRRDYRQPYYTIPGGFGSFTREISLFDIGCDGIMDILSGPERRGSPNEYVIDVLRGVGNGLFNPGLPVLAGPSPGVHDHIEATAGDMNGDGYLDLVYASNGDDRIRVRLWVP